MPFIIYNDNLNIEHIEDHEQLSSTSTGPDDLLIPDADSLLRLYVATERDTPLYTALQKIRDILIEDLDEVQSKAEIYGLIYWLLDDQGISAEGYSLEETADRLSDLDIASDTDQYTDIIFHLKDAVDRLYELELEDY